MGYPTKSTEWPSAPPSTDTQALIDRLFVLLDTPTNEAGDCLADTVFARDGILTGPTGSVQGSEAIRRSRDHAWFVVTSRRHSVIRVYAHDARSLDLLLIGHVEMGLASGKEVVGEFTARVIIAEDDSNGPKIKLYQVWADSAPLTKALQEE